jgi:hypothetical protein
MLSVVMEGIVPNMGYFFGCFFPVSLEINEKFVDTLLFKLAYSEF